MSQLSSKLAALPAALLLCLASRGFAADSAQQLPEITISGSAEEGYGVSTASTATKTDTPLIDTPLSIQVVPKDVITDRGAQRLEDVLKNVSGVQPYHAYGGANEIFVVRGFQQSPATHRNGVSAPLVRRVDLANIESVEVLKGPSATVYGSSDPGGIINVVTRLPSASPIYDLEQEVGSWDFYRTKFGASSALNGSGLSYRVDFAYQDSETFRLLSDDKRVFIAPTLSWQPSAATRINLALEHTRDELMYDSGTPAYGTGLAPILRKLSFGQPGLGDEHKSNLIDLNASHQINDHWKLSGGLLSFSIDKELREFYFFANLAVGDTDGDRFAWFGDENVKTRAIWANLVGDVQTGHVKHKLLFGTEFANTKLHSDGTDIYVDTINIFTFDPRSSNVPTAPFEVAPPDFLTNQKHRNLGLFVQDQMQFSDRLHVLAGLRYDRLDRYGYSEYFGPYDNTKRRDSKVSPRLGVTWKLTPELALYGGYSESFGPGFNFNGDAVLNPETARQYEIGLKSESKDGRFHASAALFDLTKRNIPTPHPTIPALTVSIGEANSRGLELDMHGSIGKNLSMIANYAWTDTEITYDNSGNQGNRLPHAPKHQLNLWLKYAFNTGALNGLSLGGGVYAASDRYGDVANSYKDGSFTQLDMYAAYRFYLGANQLTAQLNVNNVTDDLHYIMRSRWSNLPSAPRSVFVSLRLDF
jgi:iron complex outermembrane receptor protein